MIIQFSYFGYLFLPHLPIPFAQSRTYLLDLSLLISTFSGKSVLGILVSPKSQN